MSSITYTNFNLILFCVMHHMNYVFLPLILCYSSQNITFFLSYFVLFITENNIFSFYFVLLMSRISKILVKFSSIFWPSWKKLRNISEPWKCPELLIADSDTPIIALKIFTWIKTFDHQHIKCSQTKIVVHEITYKSVPPKFLKMSFNPHRGPVSLSGMLRYKHILISAFFIFLIMEKWKIAPFATIYRLLHTIRKPYFRFCRRIFWFCYHKRIFLQDYLFYWKNTLTRHNVKKCFNKIRMPKKIWVFRQKWKNG